MCIYIKILFESVKYVICILNLESPPTQSLLFLVLVRMRFQAEQRSSAARAPRQGARGGARRWSLQARAALGPHAWPAAALPASPAGRRAQPRRPAGRLARPECSWPVAMRLQLAGQLVAAWCGPGLQASSSKLPAEASAGQAAHARQQVCLCCLGNSN